MPQIVTFRDVKAILDRLVEGKASRLKIYHGDKFGWTTRDELLAATAKPDDVEYRLIDPPLVGNGRGSETYLVKALTTGVDGYPKMPYLGNARGEYASPSDVDTIVTWIDRGAPADPPAAAAALRPLVAPQTGKPVLCCTPKSLPSDLWIRAARTAVNVNPVNRAPMEGMRRLAGKPDLQRIAAVASKYWHTRGVRLTVRFLDGESKELKRLILSHMNAWNKTASVEFVEAETDPQVRIARINTGNQAGYWSYVGTDILSIPAGEPTMNLEGFTETTSEAEFKRVVRHETGHTMGFPHEHMRRELVDKIDPQKAIEYYGETQGWTPDEVRAQVLTPIEESSLIGTAHTDPISIMCYQIPGTITSDGKPILGGLDIDDTDYAFATTLYPKRAPSALKRGPAPNSGES